MPRVPAFRFHVAAQSGVPIYRQLIEQVRAQCQTGQLNAGDFLPSVRQVAAQLAVNPMTVSKAYSLLERDGLLESVRGQGMRVAPPAAGAAPRQRRSDLRPRIEQLVERARRAGLSPEELCALVYAAYEESVDAARTRNR